VAYGLVIVEQENLTDTYTAEQSFVAVGKNGEKLSDLNVKYSSSPFTSHFPL
jgi:hypothetical protein